MPCFIFAQEQTDANKRDTIKPSSEELYNFGTVNTNAVYKMAGIASTPTIQRHALSPRPLSK